MTDVGGHQEEAFCVDAEAIAVLAEELEARTAAVINEEHILFRRWRITALNNVVRLIRNDNSGYARHTHESSRWAADRLNGVAHLLF